MEESPEGGASEPKWVGGPRLIGLYDLRSTFDAVLGASIDPESVGRFPSGSERPALYILPTTFDL